MLANQNYSKTKKLFCSVVRVERYIASKERKQNSRDEDNVPEFKWTKTPPLRIHPHVATH